MDNKTFIDVYQTESELLAKMDELKMDGYSEEDMYVVAKSEDDVSMVRGRTNVDVEAAGGWADRFMGLMSGTDPVRQALTNTGMSDAEADRYYQQVENGGLLLYVDRSYGSRYDSDMTAGAGRAGAYDTDDETLGTTLNDRFDAPNTAGTSPGTADPNLGGNLYTGTSGTASGMNPVDNDYIPETDANDAALTNRSTDTSLTGDQETLRLHEERLSINKERVQTGEVHIEKDVIEEEQVIDVPVEREEVIVERRAVTDGDAAADTAFGDHAFENGNETIRVPITEERVEVTKKPVVSEEIVVEKRTVQDTETVRDTVRREEARVEGDESIDRDRDRL